MDVVDLARLQFAVTIGYHFIFAPLTIGLSWLLVWLMARYWRTGDPADRRLARFWVNLFAISFAAGVASGLAMEFQFGTNWAAYAKYVGDIFGPPLAAEVIFTFFLESTFLAVVALGWDRVSRRAQWFAMLLVALGSTMSAFWILVANSWMQTPAGYVIANGRAVMTDFWAVVFNPSTVPRVLHTVDAALMTGAFFMLGISAWFLLKDRHVAASRRTFGVALAVAFLTSLVQLGLGHYSAAQVAYTQPEKLAAFEGQFVTQTHAPLTVIGLLDEKRQRLHPAIRIPGMLSYLIAFRTDFRVRGLDSFPREEWPPLALTFYPFHLMFYIGLFCIAFPALGLLLAWRRRLAGARWFLWIAVLAIPLPFLANELGWMTAEIGRQPWIVYRVLRTSHAVSPTVPAHAIVFSLAAFALIYTAFSAFWVLLVRREMRRGPGEADTPPAPETAS